MENKISDNVNEKLVKIKNDIDNKIYKDIDYFNLENEINSLFSNLTDEEFKKVVCLFEDEFIKNNKNSTKKNSKEDTLFKVFESNIKVRAIRDDIDIGKYEDIDWFNLESEISNLFENLTTDELEYITYYFEKKFIKDNKKLISGYDKDKVASSVLQELSDNYLDEIPKTKLSEKNYFIESNAVSAVDKVLKIFEFHDIVSKYKQKENNRSFYRLNLDKWFEKSKYHIQDYNLISILAPIITSYINVGFIKNHSLQNLFNKISEIIEFAIRPSVYHNQMEEIEVEFLELLEDNENIDVSYKNKATDNIENINIEPIKIIYKSGEKYILAKNTKTDENIEFSLFDLRFNHDVDNSLLRSSNVPKNISMLSNTDTFTKSESTIKTKENIEVILECDSIVYEYFKMKPLSNMTVYDEENKIIEFMESYNMASKPNKFYIVASDTEDKIISIVLHTLNNVKILKPTNLNDKLGSIFKTYLDKTNVDICTKPTEPNNDNNKQNENFSDSSNNKNKKSINKDNLNINKSDDIELNL